jgi:hypothetical protein
MDIAEKYKKAKAYAEGVKTPFWQYLDAELTKRVDNTAKYAIAGGYKNRDEEHDALVMARAYKLLLLDVGGIAGKAKELREQLEETGVKVD